MYITISLTFYLMVSEFKRKLCKTNYVHYQKKAKNNTKLN